MHHGDSLAANWVLPEWSPCQCPKTANFHPFSKWIKHRQGHLGQELRRWVKFLHLTKFTLRRSARSANTTSPRSIHAGQAAPFLSVSHLASSINSRINSWINGKLKRNQMTLTLQHLKADSHPLRWKGSSPPALPSRQKLQVSGSNSLCHFVLHTCLFD